MKTEKKKIEKEKQRRIEIYEDDDFKVTIHTSRKMSASTALSLSSAIQTVIEHWGLITSKK